MKTRRTDYDRYVRITAWARRRYTNTSGRLALSERGRPTAFTRIERAAFSGYVNPRVISATLEA